ncbi:MAG: hypothetical protein KAS66_02350 [Candidatus Omnitrophica bacterium]|nr:hypothetical protein [Candidatus Omnitrophota bacterium]
MKKIIKNRGSNILSLVLIMVFLHLPAHADILDFNLDFNITSTNGGFQIHRDLDLQRRQTNEIIRGSDLSGRVASFIQKTKDSLSILKGRRLDQIRGAKLNQITNDNTKDAARRNKAAQRAQRRFQRDQMLAVKARNRDLKQRIRDLSRK